MNKLIVFLLFYSSIQASVDPSIDNIIEAQAENQQLVLTEPQRLQELSDQDLLSLANRLNVSITGSQGTGVGIFPTNNGGIFILAAGRPLVFENQSNNNHQNLIAIQEIVNNELNRRGELQGPSEEQLAIRAFIGNLSLEQMQAIINNQLNNEEQR
ncbi:MAG: hypothetical protein P4L22_07710 [Candidatus Babeliales bacterium]|nr:hypothetical protein [Candidatus Babeliales bacterium]